MSITFKSFLECLPFVAIIKKPILLRSRHGVGKSSLVYQYAESINLPVIERRASQMTEGDLLGLPKIDEGRTEFIPPAWLKDACDNPVVLFIDEIDRATPEVRQGFFELTDSRKIAGWELHKDTLIFAAINGGDHGSQYQIGEMDPAELDRWTVFDLEPSVEDWIVWARKYSNIHKVVINFITECPKHLEHDSDFEPNKVYPSRRSWHRFSDCCVQSNLIEPGNPSGILFNITQAFLGLEAAVAFQDFVRQYQKVVTAEDICIKGKIELTNDFTINDHSNLVDKITDFLENKKDKVKENTFTKYLENIADYFVIIPSECCMTLFTKISQLQDLNIITAFHAIKNGIVHKHLTKILAENPELANQEKKGDE